jgi:hypothetical protein
MPSQKGEPTARPAARPKGRRPETAGDQKSTGQLEPQQEADYLADNDTWMFGANAPAILEILDRLEEIGPEDGAALADAWLAAPKDEREAARKLARKAVEIGSDAERHLQMAREAVGTWLAVAVNRPEFVKADADWARISSRVAEAALDALTAQILEEQLDAREIKTLAAPWSRAIGRKTANRAPRPAGREAAGGDGDEGSEEEEEEGRFGPNSDAVVDLINRLWLLTPEQVTRLVVRWQATPAEDLRIAHEMLHDLVDESAEWRAEVRLAQDSLAPWLNASRVAETSGFLGQTGQADMRRMAGPVLADAVAALVLGDLLEPEDAATLYAPWFELVGAPALPEPEDDNEADGSDDSAAAAHATRR